MGAPCSVFTVFLLSSVLLGAAAGQKVAAKPIPAQWRAVTPQIQSMLSKQPSICDEGTLRAGVDETADFDGASFAVIDVCPLGAYTELMEVMQLKDKGLVRVRVRKHGHEIGTEFTRGASVMHGRNVKLVAEKRAIYDINWDNDGVDTSGLVKMQECTVAVYVWSSGTQTFDFNPSLAKQVTREYCRELEQGVH